MQQLTKKKLFKEDWSDTDDTALIIISIKYFSKRERERLVLILYLFSQQKNSSNNNNTGLEVVTKCQDMSWEAAAKS